MILAVFLHLASCISVSVCIAASAEDQEALINAIIEKQKAVQTLAADFTQEKRSAMLAEPLVSKGTFKYMAPDKVVWLYTKQVTITSDGRDLTVYYPELKEAEIVPLQKSLVRLPLNFNIAEFRKHFKIAVALKDGLYRTTLTPVEETSLFAKMVITITEEGVPQTVEIFEKGGDRSIIRFKNQKINTKLSEKLFKADLPKDTAIRRFQQP